MISMGNSLPSLRRAVSSMPVPICCASASAAERAVGDQPLGEADGDDVGDLLSDQFVAAVAELLFGLEIEEDDLAVLVDHDHRVRRRFEQPAIAAFHLRQMRFHLLTYAKIADCGRGPWQAVWACGFLWNA